MIVIIHLAHFMISGNPKAVTKGKFLKNSLLWNPLVPGRDALANTRELGEVYWKPVIFHPMN